MGYIRHVSHRKHNEFSYEEGEIRFWWNGSVRSVYNIDEGEIEYYDELTEQEKDELYYLTMCYYRDIEDEL